MKRIMLSLLMVFTASFLAAENQGWINNSLTMKINPKLSLQLANEIRCHEITYAGSFLTNWQGGVIYKISKSFQLGLHYKREITDKTAYYLKENRYTVSAGWNRELSKIAKLSIQAWVDFREYDKELSQDNIRFHLMLKLSGKSRVGSLILKPFIAFRPFADTKDDKLNAHRLYLGTAIQLSPKIDLTVNYIRLDMSGKDPIHILNSGLAISI